MKGGRIETLWKGVLGSLQKTILAVILVLIVVLTTLLGVISYGQYRRIITASARTLNLSNTSQIASDIEGILKDTRNDSLSSYQNDMVRDYLLAREPRQVEDAWYSLNQCTLNQLAYEEYTYTADFARMDGQQYSSSSVTEGISEEVREILLVKGRGTVFRTDVRVTNYGGLKGDELYGHTRYIHDINDIGTPIGFQQICLKKQEPLRLLNSYRADGEEYYIMENGDVIISTDEEAVGTPVTSVFPKLNLSEGYSSQQMKVDGVMVMTACARMKYPGWYVVKQISLSEIDGETAMVRQLSISAGILAVVLCAMVGFFLSRFVVRPLKGLESSMKHIEEDNFRRKLPEEDYQEPSLLAGAFDRMSTRLGELVNRVYPAEIREKDARIRVMQVYISPRFLYNILDTICWASRMEQVGGTCKPIEVLSKLFRASVEDMGKTTIVAAELKHIKDYIMIQRYRHTNSVEFKTEAAKEVMNCETMRSMLRPLAENAIVHGLELTGGQGITWIRVYGEQGKLIMFVEGDDLDVGVEELGSLLARHQEGLRGMGLSNVNDRICLCYGEGYGTQLERREPEGLTVWVIQSLVAGGDQKEEG